ncbi:MAG: thioesterase [Rhodobacterales bacterium]|nr:MAG: thioesterase [Rhodobacterales bacterium]
MPQPFTSARMRVEPQWIDYNGHLNMAYYHVLLDRGVDQLWEQLGFGSDYTKRTGHTTFSAEYHIRYLREIHEGDSVRATFQLLDHTDRSFHFYQELIHSDGWVSAAGEGVGLHIDQSGPRVAPMPDEIHTRFQTLMKDHSALPRPEMVGKPMGIRRK